MLAAQPSGQVTARFSSPAAWSMNQIPITCSTGVLLYRMGNADLVDGMIHDGLWCAEKHHMGNSAEWIACEYGVTRQAQGRVFAGKPPAPLLRWMKAALPPRSHRSEIAQRKGPALRD